MFKMDGNNDFRDRFDFFKWSAPVYETPREVVETLNKMEFKNKQIDRIRCIGPARIIGLNPYYLCDVIKKAGIKLGDNWRETYPYLFDMPIERKVRLCEPIQLIFTDGTTFEFIPMSDGGARFSQNSIPINLVDGLNKTNIDLSRFMGDIRGQTIESFEMRRWHSSEEFYHCYKSMKWDKPYSEVRTKYRYILHLKESIRIVIEMDWESYFTVELEGCDPISYKSAKECIMPTDQIYITAGRDGGGTFWIVPCYSEDKPYEKQHNISDYDNCGMSINEFYVGEFLTEFLHRHFDLSIQDKFHYVDGFDWYGYNLFSRESIKKIITEIRETVTLLINDYENPALDDIKKHFSVFTFLPDCDIEVSKEQENTIIREHIDIAIDFYDRFANRLETMLAVEPDCDVISFAGP